MLTTDLNYNSLIIKMGEKIKNAGRRGINFDFTLAQFTRLFQQGECAYSNKPFDSVGDMTIERIDPLLGYTHGNCVIVRDLLNVHRKPLDEFLRDEHTNDVEKVLMLELALKAAKKRVVEAGRIEQERLLAQQQQDDASMLGGRLVLDKRSLKDDDLVAITLDHLPCDRADSICRQNHINYLVWLKYGAMAVMDKDAAFIKAVKDYYTE